MAAELADHLGVEALVDAARERAREHDHLGAAGEVVDLLAQDLELLRVDERAPLDDLRVLARGRVDDRRRRPRLVLDPDEVVEHRLFAQLLEDAPSVAAADEAGRDDGHAEPLERARDDDPLAARERQLLARPVALAALEVRHGQDPVERRVHGDGDDQAETFLAEPAADVVERPLRVPAYASEGARPRDRAVGDERRAGDDLAAVVDAHLAEPLARLGPAARRPSASRRAPSADGRGGRRGRSPSRRRARAGACPRARSRSRTRGRSRRRGRRGTARAPRRGAARGRRCAPSGSARRAASRRSSRRVPARPRPPTSRRRSYARS